MPTSVAGFERIKDIPVTAPPTIDVTGSGATDTFGLVSVVCAVTNPAIDPKEIGNYVIGSKTYLYNNDIVQCYNPSGVNGPTAIPAPLPSLNSINIVDKTIADNEIKTCGLIYIYQNKSDTADKALAALFM
jgi:hypothetical protein